MRIVLGIGCAVLTFYSLTVDLINPDVGRHKATLVYMALTAVFLMTG